MLKDRASDNKDYFSIRFARKCILVRMARERRIRAWKSIKRWKGKHHRVLKEARSIIPLSLHLFVLFRWKLLWAKV